MKIEIIQVPQEIVDKVNIEIYGSLEAAEKAKKEEAKLWCQGHGEENSGAYYVPDGKSKECHKHHWRCYKCDKIVQIG